MGGRGETSDQKIRATQDQLRLARITQDVSSVDDDRINVQKLIKKVVETTRCSVSQAEIALFDTDNNVEEAVNLILEETYAEDNVWKEQKSRKAKRAEAEERAEEQLVSAHRSRNHAPRSANNFSGSNRGRGSERGRGGYRGGARGRGNYTGRGGYLQHQSSTVAANNNMWDNSQAVKVVDPSKEWANNATANSVVDDVPEDTDWKTAGTLVFSRRDDTTPPLASSQQQQPTLNATSSTNAGSATTTGPISFAAVAAARAKQQQQPKEQQAKGSTPTNGCGVLTSTAQSTGSASTTTNHNQQQQSTLDSGINSLYQNKGVSAQSRDAEPNDQEKACGSKTASTPTGATMSVQRQTAAAGDLCEGPPSILSTTTTQADWTAQLKNDLGIGGAKPAPVQSTTVSQSQKQQVESIQKQAPVKQTSVARPMVQMMHHPTQHQHHQQIPHNTVEFVSGGDANGPTPLPEYQFGFHVETGVTAGVQDHQQQTVAAGQPQQPQDDVFNTAASKQRSMNHRPAAKIEPEMPTDSSATMMSNGAVCDFSSPISSQQQQSKNVSSNGGVGLVPASHASTVASMQQQQQQQQTRQQHTTAGLSYADTSSMSYPSSENTRAGNTNAIKPSLSLHQQQQAQHQLYTAAQIPYNSYPYVNMYSPVTGVRQDEAQYAAALVQYPFGVGQIDMSSLSTMIPPAALASQQQANQPPPPPVQPQHQQRPDQHASYLDPKAYAAAANSTAGSGSALLGSQQQRDSTSVSGSAVAPPPGFSGPPSNMPTAAFTLPQHNHISSLFQVPPTYHPQLNQLPFSFMLPSVTNSAQHKLNHQMYAQQVVDDTLSDQRLSSQQQKVYGGHQQMDKYGSSGGAKDRLGGGAQATPPPQMYQPQQNYLSQQMQPMHTHNKKTYGNGPQHWSQS